MNRVYRRALISIAVLMVCSLMWLPTVYGLALDAPYVRIDSEDIHEETEAFIVDVTIPVLVGLPTADIEELVNSAIEKEAMDFTESIRDLADSAERMVREGEIDSFFAHEASISYVVRFANRELISLTLLYYAYTGGAHGIYFQICYTIDLHTGDFLYIDDVFIEDSGYEDALILEINRQIEEDIERYFDSAVPIEEIYDDQPFYIAEAGCFEREDAGGPCLVIYYGLYEITPYAAGIQEFAIPLRSMVDYVNPEFAAMVRLD